MTPREARLQRLYGLSEYQYTELLARQGHVCALCYRIPTGRRLDVDHDHRTGEIRGLLCHLCNRALGMVRGGSPDEMADVLMAMAKYVKNKTGWFVPKRPRKRRKK